MALVQYRGVKTKVFTPRYKYELKLNQIAQAMNRLFFLLLALPATAFAQCDPPTPVQNAAYEKVVRALQSEFKSNLPSGNWTIFDERHSLGKLTLSDEYGKTFRICGDRYDLTIERASQTANRRARIDSAVAKTQRTPVDSIRQETSLIVITDSLYKATDGPGTAKLAQNTVDINVEMNVANYRLSEPISNRVVDNYKLIAVKGANLAMQLTRKDNDEGTSPRPETVVLLGNWKNNMVSDRKGNKVFKFSYGKGGTLIENLVVTIKGPLAIADEIIKKVDWTKLAGTLTR